MSHRVQCGLEPPANPSKRVTGSTLPHALCWLPCNWLGFLGLGCLFVGVVGKDAHRLQCGLKPLVTSFNCFNVSTLRFTAIMFSCVAAPPTHWLCAWHLMQAWQEI